MAKYLDEEGQVIIDNFYDHMEQMSYIAQEMSGIAPGNMEQFSGGAAAIYTQIEICVSNYGPGWTGECVEESRPRFPDFDEVWFYYPSDDPNIVGNQRLVISSFTDFSTYFLRLLQQRADEEEARREEEAEARARAREQAEKARETEEKYKSADMVKEAAGRGAGIGSRILGAVSSLFKGIFGRK